MGLFSSEPKMTNEQLFEKYKQDIIDADYLISLELATGTHGADEIVAGAMMGETGKLIAMSNYGKTIWKNTNIQLRNEGFIVLYNGVTVFYESIIGFNRGKSGWRGMEFVIHTTNGDWWFRADPIFAEAVMAVINALKDFYLSKLEEEKKQNELEKQQEKQDKEMDRLLRAAELHERGLLSKEEFEEIKARFLNNKSEDKLDEKQNLGADEDVEVSSIKYCPNCGAEIGKDYKFCIGCGYELK